MTYRTHTLRRILTCAAAAATMRDDTSRAVPLEYDKRFLEDGELDALANYYGSIQNEDVALFQS